MSAAWTREEIELIVADYLSMLIDELRHVPYNKAAHRKELLSRLNGRSSGSVEYKHQNISAVLVELGYPCIDGYKPAYNYQRGLFPEIVQQQAESNELLRAILERSSAPDETVRAPSVEDILSVLVEAPEPRDRNAASAVSSAQPIPRKRDYIKLESTNARLGLLGEQFVLNFERTRLIVAGKHALADRIEHVSQTVGDGAGFDIKSYEENGQDRLIEVKTTKYSRYAPFYLTRNEVQTSLRRAESYYLYRLFNFEDSPRLFTLKGELSHQLVLTPVQFIAEL